MSLIIKLNSFNLGNMDAKELSEQLTKAISEITGIPAAVQRTDYDGSLGCSHKENEEWMIEMVPATFYQRTKITFGSGEYSKEFIFDAFDDLEDVFAVLEVSGCYSETGGGWRYIYRNLFEPLCQDYLSEPRKLEQRKEHPHIVIEPLLS